MPFKSQAQQRWMFARHPEMATRWAADTPKGQRLPEHVKHARRQALLKGLKGLKGH